MSTTSVFASPDVKTDPLRFVVSMDQQLIMMYLSLKGLNAVEMHNDLIATLKGEAKSSRVITYYLRKASLSSQKHPSLLRAQLQFSPNRMKQSCWLYLKSLSRRCGNLRAEPIDTFHSLRPPHAQAWVHRSISSLGPTSSVGS
jgi:hypothetical protein